MHSENFPDNQFAIAEAIVRAHRLRAERDPDHVRRSSRLTACVQNWKHRTLHGE